MTSSSDHIELTISDQPPPLHNKDTGRDNICNISRMFEMSMEVILALEGFTPGIVSHVASRPVRWEGSMISCSCAPIVRPEAPW